MNNMLKTCAGAALLAAMTLPAGAKENFTITLNPQESAPVISPEI